MTDYVYGFFGVRSIRVQINTHKPISGHQSEDLKYKLQVVIMKLFSLICKLINLHQLHFIHLVETRAGAAIFQLLLGHLPDLNLREHFRLVKVQD